MWQTSLKTCIETVHVSPKKHQLDSQGLIRAKPPSLGFSDPVVQEVCQRTPWEGPSHADHVHCLVCSTVSVEYYHYSEICNMGRSPLASGRQGERELLQRSSVIPNATWSDSSTPPPSRWSLHVRCPQSVSQSLFADVSISALTSARCTGSS